MRRRRDEYDFRLDEAAERFARLLVAFRKLASAYHATHDRAGFWLTCSDAQCRENVTRMRELTDPEAPKPTP
jgi:hypothetical protein